MKLKTTKLNQGMTYVELIVVLSIFSMMASISFFNYGSFQGKIDVKNLVNDIALKVVEAQKAATFGQLTSHTSISNWKPAYGVYFTIVANGLADNKSFNYLADLNNSGDYGDATCVPATLANECLDKINITKGNYVSTIIAYYQNGSTQTLNDISIIFKRPDGGAILKSTSILSTGVSYIQITVSTPKGQTSKVKVYSSGRVEIM